MKNIKIYLLKLGIATTVIVIGSLFYLFDGFITKISQESLSNWLKMEEASILEGNLLTSVAKNQRAVFSSEFLKGFMLADFSKEGQIEQIGFGDSIETNLINSSELDTKVQIIRTGLFKKYAVAKIPGSGNKAIIFSFWSKDLYTIFFSACLLFFIFFVFFGFLLAKAKRREEKRALEYAESAARVAHDIRSPLVRLSSFIDKFDDNKTKEALSEIAQNITDITSDLILNRRKGIQKINQQLNASIPKVTSLGEALRQLLAAKRELYSHIIFTEQIDIASNAIALDHKELIRSLSNLIDNSVDASEGNGTVTLTAIEQANSVLLTIEDTGKGISEVVLKSVGSKGFTHGKKNGSGLGVYYTEQAILSVGGSLKIESEERKGTRVILEIPFKKTRAISNKEIHIEKGSSLLVLDDDPLIRKTWNDIFEKRKLGKVLDIQFFCNSAEILASKVKIEKAFLLTDFDLKEEIDGLDIIGKLGAHDSTLLVTGMASSSKVQSKAHALGGIPILPKADLEKLNIVIV